MEQELLTLPEDLSSPLVFSGVRVAQSLVLCVCFVLFLLAIVMSVRLRFTDSDNPFGIFKLFLKKIKKNKNIYTTCCTSRRRKTTNNHSINQPG